jgi:hypothetical protein
MEARPQFVRHLYLACPQATGFNMLGGYWEVSQICPKEVQVKEWSWMMLAD